VASEEPALSESSTTASAYVSEMCIQVSDKACAAIGSPVRIRLVAVGSSPLPSRRDQPVANSVPNTQPDFARPAGELRPGQEFRGKCRAGADYGRTRAAVQFLTTASGTPLLIVRSSSSKRPSADTSNGDRAIGITGMSTVRPDDPLIVESPESE
jgi:hypothetical protein